MSALKHGDLLAALVELPPMKVESFSITLGVPKRIIDEARENHQGNVYRIKSEAVSWWLANADAISWDVVARALETPGVDERNLAKKIRSNYGAMEDQSMPISYHDDNHPADRSPESRISTSPSKREENICKLAEIPHKQSSLPIPNPVVQFSELNIDEQEDLQAQMKELKFEIHRKFLKFEAKLVNSLRERITTVNMVRTLMEHFTVYPTESMYNISLLQGYKKELLEAKDIEEVFMIIHPFYSYYNYELLQTIVDVHGSREDGERMRQYIIDFTNYCRRVPCMEFYDDHSHKSLKQVKLKFKLDYDKNLLTLADIKNIKHHIAKILNIRSSILFLHSVQDGCTAVIFLVPDPCIHAVLKLLKEKSSILQREVKMMTIECDGKPIDEVLVPEIEVEMKAVNFESDSGDSGISSICQNTMELDYERGSTAESYASRCSVVTELEKVDEGEMDEDEPLQAATVGEDCPDCPESVCSQAIRGVYPLLVEVFSNQESADKLASDLYSKFLIENTIQGEVRMQGITDEEKAQRILNAVMSKLRTSPTHEPFEHFMSVLKCYHSCCDIVVQMRATYQQLQKSSEASGMCYSYAYHNAREELVCGNSTLDAAPLEHQMQGGPHSSIKEHQPVSLSGAFESLKGHHQERKSTIFSMLRQCSISSGGESDVSITSEVEMQDRLKKWEKEGKTLMRGLRKCMDKKQKNASTMEEIAHRLESMVEDLQTQVEEYTKKLKRCTEEKQVLEGELTIARRRILQLNREVITMKKHPRACAGACEHKSKCEKLEKQIKRLEEEKVDYTAKIKNLNQQIDMLLSDDHLMIK